MENEVVCNVCGYTNGWAATRCTYCNAFLSGAMQQEIANTPYTLDNAIEELVFNEPLPVSYGDRFVRYGSALRQRPEPMPNPNPVETDGTEFIREREGDDDPVQQWRPSMEITISLRLTPKELVEVSAILMMFGYTRESVELVTRPRRLDREAGVFIYDDVPRSLYQTINDYKQYIDNYGFQSAMRR
jgi:hypothetical protein